MSEMLKILLANGSLSERLLESLALAGYSIQKPDRTGFCAVANGVGFYQFDRRMIPAFLCGMEPPFDAGITGRDLWLASGYGTDLRVVTSLCFSRRSSRPTCWVLAGKKGRQYRAWEEIRIGCELPFLAEKLLAKAPLPFQKYEIEKIEGSEEACVRYGVTDLVLTVTETGESLAANGLEILPGCEKLLESTPVILAQKSLVPEKEELLQALRFSLEAVCGAKEYVTVSFDIPCTVDVPALRLPSAVAPSLQRLTDAAWNACEICCKRSELGGVLLTLRASGAKAIIVRELQGYLP